MTIFSRLPLLALLALTAVAPACRAQDDSSSTSTVKGSTVPLWGDYPNERPICVKGIHVSAWYAGHKKLRTSVEKLLAETELNTLIIDIKESEGEVYIPGVKLAGEANYVAAMPDIKEYLKFLKA